MSGSLEDVGNRVKYFDVGSMKFVLMSICTFGLYEMYWNYKNWAFIKGRDQSTIIPLVRAIFYQLWYYSLLTNLANNSESKVLRSSVYRGFLAISLILIYSTAWSRDPYSLYSMFTFLPMSAAVSAISKENCKTDSINLKSRRYQPANFVAFIVGGPLVALTVLSVVGVFPSSAVVSGSSLSQKQLLFLKKQQILGESEKISYFYSEGLFSISEGGQFISDEYVTSYWMDSDTDEISVAYASYAEIEDIAINWSDSEFEDTIVTILLSNGEEFDLWLSSELKGDELFISTMKANWQKSRTF